MALRSDCGLLLGTGVQLVVSCTTIEIQIFSRHFLCSSLVNLPLLASLEEKSTHREFDCFLGVGNRDSLEGNILADEAAKDRFTLFWEAMVGPEVEAFSCF